ncbi:hypothetical protein CSUI_006999 [Cystoisospora suis]|uniref:Uncharacterized protein n=1 Tax=Cystoisospora suis TaxID=483139 RepID=A0A2C6KS51_9APIC|nr:hypothetical protein CSUI_006999 [Cystoisospora suis]
MRLLFALSSIPSLKKAIESYMCTDVQIQFYVSVYVYIYLYDLKVCVPIRSLCSYAYMYISAVLSMLKCTSNRRRQGRQRCMHLFLSSMKRRLCMRKCGREGRVIQEEFSFSLFLLPRRQGIVNDGTETAATAIRSIVCIL